MTIENLAVRIEGVVCARVQIWTEREMAAALEADIDEVKAAVRLLATQGKVGRVGKTNNFKWLLPIRQEP